MNRSVSRVLGALAMIGAFAVAGCQSRVNTVETTREPPGVSPVAKEHVVADPGLAKDLPVTDLRESRTDEGVLRAQLSVRNTSRSGMVLRYRFIWLDEAGMQIDSYLSTWREHYIHPGETFRITGTAPGLRAKDYSIQLREKE